MSEPISAFSAYKANGAAKTKVSKKNNKDAEKKSTTSGTNKSKIAGSEKTKKKDNNNNSSTKIKKEKLTDAASKTKISNNTEIQKSKTNPRSCPLPSASTNKKKGNFIKLTVEDEITVDNVEAWSELLFDTNRKLDAKLKKKKKELESFLRHAMSSDTSFDADEEEDIENTSSEGNSMFEYTMNSYSEESDNENEWTDVSTEERTPHKQQLREKNATTKNKKQTSVSETSSQTRKRKLNDPADKKTTTDKKSGNKKNCNEMTLYSAKLNVVKSADKQKKLDPSPQHTNENNLTNLIIKKETKSPQSTSTSTEVSIKDSILEGKRVFGWLMHPVTPEQFFENYWETNVCLIKRGTENFFKELISFEAIDEMLIKNHIEFTTNIDITSYVNGERETLNPEGRAMPPVVWAHYSDGCSIRLLNPHTFLPKLFTLNSTLQEYFHCLVGANVYLTPPNSQGFAPHYDDIEAFVLQIEGRKRWKLYKPLSEHDMLARESSHNFTQKEIGTPVFEQVLEPGDVLYFPRGTIHQACTEPGHHSLHITLSVYQKQAYADLFEKLMPLVLQDAIKKQLEVRRGLPLHTFRHLGLAYSETDTEERHKLQAHIQKLYAQHLKPNAEQIDAAVDQLAKKYQHEALPPQVQPDEIPRTVFGSRNRTNKKGEVVYDYEIKLHTNVRLLRANCVRLVREDGNRLRVYYYIDNAREYCKYEPNFIEIESDNAASIETLIRYYPSYISVSQLPLKDDENKIDLVTALWERGLLMTDKPFKSI